MNGLLTDEHVPRVFVTTLRSNGYTVRTATDIFGEGTDDRTLLEYCANNDYVLVTNDKKDFAGELGASVPHAGIIIYTDSVFLRANPEDAVRTLERVFEQYPPEERSGERVWLDQWRH